MSQSPDTPGTAELKHPAPILHYYRQPGGSLGLVEPLTILEIENLLAALGLAVSSDDPQVTPAFIKLHWAIVHFVNDVIGKACHHPEQTRKYLQRVISDPENALADLTGPPYDAASLARAEVEIAVHHARTTHPPAGWLAEAALLARLTREVASRLLRAFRGHDARRDYALASFLAVTIYVVEELGGDLSLPQHDRDDDKTTALFTFASEALAVAAAKGIAVASANRADQAIALFRAHERKPVMSRSAFIKNLEAARSAAKEARQKA